MNRASFYQIIRPLDESELVYDARAGSGEWCRLPYPGHPKGCPSVGMNVRCPTQSTPLEPCACLLVAVRFDLQAWADGMKVKHPEWSDRQCRCCLYWQGKTRKRLKRLCEKARNESFYNGDPVYTPEARGLDITKIMSNLGWPLEWPPKRYVWTVAIIQVLQNGSIPTHQQQFSEG